MDFSSIAAFANSPASWGMASMVSAIGGRFVFSELTPSQQRIMRHPLTRRFVTFCMAFVVTRNVKIAFIITAGVIMILEVLANENSRFCMFFSPPVKILTQI
jgi:hypothetical protein